MRPRERALKLVERHARLQRRHRLDKVGHGFRLHEVERPFRKARSVNSPGSASRAPAATAARTISASSATLPWTLISMTSSPV